MSTDIEALRRLAEDALGWSKKATRGPWVMEVGCSRRCVFIYPQCEPPRPLLAEISLGPRINGSGKGGADAEFITHSRTALPTLAQAILDLTEAKVENQ